MESMSGNNRIVSSFYWTKKSFMMAQNRKTGTIIVVSVMIVAAIGAFVLEKSVGTLHVRLSRPDNELAEPWENIHTHWMFHAQFLSDFWIALAYFSIPLELVYFMSKSQIFPFRWILLLFSAFIVLCGLTHAMNIWIVGDNSAPAWVVATILKVSTALVSCITAVVLVHLIPELLSLKVREIYLKNKADELDREVGLIRNQEETGRMVRMLTNQIRTSLDRHTILNTTLVELARTLDLSNCCIFMPSHGGSHLALSHSLVKTRSPSKAVPITDSVVQRVVASNGAQVLPSTCLIAQALTQPGGRPYERGALAAVRVPLLQTANFSEAEVAAEDTKFALMVLALPHTSARRWHAQGLSLIETVADQVAVALSHAAVLALHKANVEKLEAQGRALRVARIEARAAHDARDTFLSVMNHEMRTPMHAIIALLSVFDDSGLGAEQQNIMHNIKVGAFALYKLVDDVLDFSLLEDNNLGLNVRTFEVGEAFAATRRALDPLIFEKRLRVDVHLDPSLPPAAVGDRNRVVQVLSYVLDNACKFTPRGGAIFVSVSAQEFAMQLPPPGSRAAEQNGDGVGHMGGGGGLQQLQLQPAAVTWAGPTFYMKVVVKDTGMGVEPTLLPKLFCKFMQADSTMTRKFGGSGLGLAICRGLCRLHGGDITIHSEGVGQGACVTFLMQLGYPPGAHQEVAPFRQAPAGAGAPSGREGNHLVRRLYGVKILVIDDNLVNRMVSRSLLHSLGCEVELAASGEEGLAALARPNHGVRLVLLDLCMPDVDGFEVALRIYAAFADRERPLVVAYTANTEKDTRARCHALGMDGIVTKPVSRDDLGEILCTLLGL